MLVVDILIVLVLAAYALFGYRRGFIAHMAELVGFVVGFALAFLLYRPLGDGLAALLRLPEGIVDLMSFLLIWFGVEMGISFGWRKVAKRIPANITHAPANRLAGIAPHQSARRILSFQRSVGRGCQSSRGRQRNQGNGESGPSKHSRLAQWIEDGLAQERAESSVRFSIGH